MRRVFLDLIANQFEGGKFVCVGLDTDYDKMPACMRKQSKRPATNRQKAELVFRFNCAIVKATADTVCAYKLNSAFYEKLGDEGVRTIRRTIEFINEHYPHVVVIEDAKRGDIDNTNEGYVYGALDHRGADAMTISPYLGGEALKPFLSRRDKGFFVLCRTSNAGGDRYQKQKDMSGKLLFESVAEDFSTLWNENRNCGLVAGAGAADPEDIATIRLIVGPYVILLIPGIGKQGGSVALAVRAGRGYKCGRFLINSSRDIIFASSGEDFAEAARIKVMALHDEITRCRLAA